MPRVLDRAQRSLFSRKRIRCGCCIALVEYNLEEVRGGGHSPEYIICPDCKKRIEIPEE